MKIPANAPKTLNDILSALCDNTNGCIDLDCSECVFEMHKDDAGTNKSKVEAYNQMKTYIAHARLMT